MARKPPVVGAVKGRSEEDLKSLRNEIIEGARSQLDELAAEMGEQTPEPTPPPRDQNVTEEGKKRRNHKIFINYFSALDDIIADSYEKQKAAYEITRAVTQMFESRGQNVPFDESRFERAAQSMAMVQMMREMAWLFGIDSEHTDQIVSHTIDRLFGPPIKKG